MIIILTILGFVGFSCLITLLFLFHKKKKGYLKARSIISNLKKDFFKYHNYLIDYYVSNIEEVEDSPIKLIKVCGVEFNTWSEHNSKIYRHLIDLNFRKREFNTWSGWISPRNIYKVQELVNSLSGKYKDELKPLLREERLNKILDKNDHN